MSALKLSAIAFLLITMGAGCGPKTEVLPTTWQPGLTDKYGRPIDNKTLGEISGLVRDASGAPVSMADIAIRSQNQKDTIFDSTDANGRFRVKVPEGQFDVTASYGVLAKNTGTLMLLRGKTVALIFDLLPPTQVTTATSEKVATQGVGSISGRLKEIGTGQAVSGGVISAIRRGEVGGAQAISSDNGSFVVPGLIPGVYDVSLYYQLVDRGTIEITRNNIVVTSGTKVDLDIEVDTRTHR